MLPKEYLTYSFSTLIIINGSIPSVQHVIMLRSSFMQQSKISPAKLPPASMEQLPNKYRASPNNKVLRVFPQDCCG